MKALDIIFLAVTGALMMGALGYWLGSILENPQGNSPKGTHKPAQALASGGSNDLLTDSGSEPSDSEEMGISIELPETYTSSHFSEDTNKLPT
jgi:phage tail tape-measure protein